jgi:hypothetical protein
VIPFESQGTACATPPASLGLASLAHPFGDAIID